MTADNVFELIKADKYSQEGRDKIGSIMSEEVEDKVYNIGDISQKTGLMKTANGWVEPPKGKAPKSNVPGNKPLNNKYYKNDVRTEEGEKKILSETKTEVLQNKVKDLENLKERNGGKLGVQGEKSLQLAKSELDKRNGNSGMSKHWVQKGDKADFVERTPQEEKAMWGKVAARQSDEKLKLAIKNREGRELKPVEKIKLEAAKEELAKRNSRNPESKSAGKAKFDEYGLPSNETIAMKDKFLKENNISDPSKLSNAEFNSLAEKLDKSLGIGNKERAQELLIAEKEESKADAPNIDRVYKKETSDSAPRCLTGDCKIRIRK